MRGARPGADGGATLRVQYFQRARMEHHPELAGTPYEVQLGLLGTGGAAPAGLDALAPVRPGHDDRMVA